MVAYVQCGAFVAAHGRQEPEAVPARELSSPITW